jgi:superkiller protein 3
MGFAIIMSTGLCGIAKLNALRGRAMPIMLSVVLVITALYCAGTIKRNPVYKDEITLWSDTVKKSPDSGNPHYNLGVVYSERGRIDEAIEEYKESLRLEPHSAKPHNNLGVEYYNLGRLDDAIREFETALELKPQFADAHYNLGIALGDKGDHERAYIEIKKAMSLSEKFMEELE